MKQRMYKLHLIDFYVFRFAKKGGGMLCIFAWLGRKGQHLFMWIKKLELASPGNELRRDCSVFEPDLGLGPQQLRPEVPLKVLLGKVT